MAAASDEELLFGDDGTESTKQDDEFDCIVQELQVILMDDEFSARQEAFFATHCGACARAPSPLRCAPSPLFAAVRSSRSPARPRPHRPPRGGRNV